MVKKGSQKGSQNDPFLAIFGPPWDRVWRKSRQGPYLIDKYGVFAHIGQKGVPGVVPRGPDLDPPETGFGGSPARVPI